MIIVVLYPPKEGKYSRFRAEPKSLFISPCRKFIDSILHVISRHLWVVCRRNQACVVDIAEYFNGALVKLLQ